MNLNIRGIDENDIHHMIPMGEGKPHVLLRGGKVCGREELNLLTFEELQRCPFETNVLKHSALGGLTVVRGGLTFVRGGHGNILSII